MRPTITRRRVPVALALCLAAALTLSACGGGTSGETSPPASDAGFPVTIEHAFGSTEIRARPQRVVTWGWGSTDAAIALGVVPVAIPHDDYAGDEEGVLPWVREGLESLGAEVPMVLPSADDPPIEAIAAAEPDLILAPYSGITKEQYRTLSQVAPTVVYPEEPWATPWRHTIHIVGRSLGKADEATALLDDIDDRVAAAAAAHPELAGKTVAHVWPAPNTFYVYKPADPRVQFTLELGLDSAPSVDELSEQSDEDESFYYTISHELVGDLTSDILVSYADTQEQAQQFLDAPTAQAMEQVRRGRVASVVGTDFISSVSPPTALSLVWGLDDYVETLAHVARAIDAAPAVG